jgi:hypothetical protein
MNVAVIFAALLAATSVHSAPQRATSFDWARGFFKAAANPVVTAGSPGKSFCVQHQVDLTTMIDSLKVEPRSYYFVRSTMTRSLCQSSCQAKQQGFYAVFEGRRCYCLTTTFSELENLELGQCTTPCTGNFQETCGGPSSSFIHYAQ